MSDHQSQKCIRKTGTNRGSDDLGNWWVVSDHRITDSVENLFTRFGTRYSKV